MVRTFWSHSTVKYSAEFTQKHNDLTDSRLKSIVHVNREGVRPQMNIGAAKFHRYNVKQVALIKFYSISYGDPLKSPLDEGGRSA